MKSFRMVQVIISIVFLFLISSCSSHTALVQMAQPDPPGQGVKESVIQRISFTEQENHTSILIEGSETISPPFYKLMPDPTRVVIDIPNRADKRAY